MAVLQVWSTKGTDLVVEELYVHDGLVEHRCRIRLSKRSYKLLECSDPVP
uniref:Uncharacterized protein n=1 Tax=Arundo donax TaxID=35708 RepID=A0A0A9DUE5_ARUDO